MAITAALMIIMCALIPALQVDGLQAEPVGPVHTRHDFNENVQFNKIWTNPQSSLQRR